MAKRGEIFKEFHRLEQGARIARGLGLGLSIVERLARVLNHGIALDANASGGSFFSVTVPVASAVNHHRRRSPARRRFRRTPMSGALIVCIENDPAILDGMKTLLTAWDAEVIAVADPDAADRGDRGRRRAASPACWSTIISTAATASPRSATSAAASARTFRRS